MKTHVVILPLWMYQWLTFAQNCLSDELYYMSLSPCCFVVPQDLVMDILRVLTTPDLEVRKKTLQLALDLVSSRNVEEVSECVLKTNTLGILSFERAQYFP